LDGGSSLFHPTSLETLYILLHDKKISVMKDLLPLLEQVARSGVETELILLRELNIEGAMAVWAVRSGARGAKGLAGLRMTCSRFIPS
jgi:chaperonin GroEL